MRLGLFYPLYGAILLVLALGAQLPLGAPVPAGPPAPPNITTPQCLSLAYARGISGGMPTSMRLLAEPAPLWPDHAYKAIGGPEDILARDAAWRPAGPDSIDIGWHHSPILRLPIHGDTLVGRGMWRWVGSLASAIGVAHVPVRAVRVQC